MTRLDKPTRLDLAARGLKVTELLARQCRMLRDRGEAALERSPLRPRAREALTRYREAARGARERLGRPSTPSARLQAAIETGGKLQPDWLPAGCVLLPVELAENLALGAWVGGCRLLEDAENAAGFEHDQAEMQAEGERYQQASDATDALLDTARAQRPATALVPLELLRRLRHCGWIEDPDLRQLDALLDQAKPPCAT